MESTIKRLTDKLKEVRQSEGLTHREVAANSNGFLTGSAIGVMERGNSFLL